MDLAEGYGFDQMEDDERTRNPMFTLVKNFDKWFFKLSAEPKAMPINNVPLDIGTRVYLAKDWSEQGSSFNWDKCAVLLNVGESVSPSPTVGKN